MGLIQNVIEAHGASTISLTVHPHISKKVGLPRGLYMRFPQGNMFGEPGQADQQRRILRTVLRAVETIRAPGTILEYPYRWKRTLGARAAEG